MRQMVIRLLLHKKNYGFVFGRTIDCVSGFVSCIGMQTSLIRGKSMVDPNPDLSLYKFRSSFELKPTYVLYPDLASTYKTDPFSNLDMK